MLQQDIATLRSSAAVLPENASRTEILNSVATMLEAIGSSKFKSLHGVEYQQLDTLRAAKVEGTVMEPIATALQLSGRDPGSTVGGVMDNVPLTQQDVNYLACHCHNGDEVSGSQAASNLRNLAKKG